MPKIKASEFIFNRIAEYGIDFVPIYQSGNALNLIDAVGTNPKIKEFVNYHEQGCGLAAEAYGRFKHFGVCLVGSGPAATNLSTAIMSAYCDSIPCLFITGQVGMFHNKKNKPVRQRGFQEVDVVEHMKPITKYAKLIENIEDLRYELEKAIHLAISGRPGPVVLDIPFNIQNSEVDPENLRSFEKKTTITDVKEDEKNFEYIIQEINSSNRPLLLLGGGIRSCDDTELTLSLFEKLNLPIATTWAATDILYFNHNLNLGNAGRSGNRSAIYAIQESDLIISLGCRFTTKVIINEKEYAKNAKIIGVDIDQGELDAGLIKVHKKINRDLKEFIPRFNNYFEKNSLKKIELKNEWIIRIESLKKDHYEIDESIKDKEDQYISPYYFMKKLFEIANSDAIFIPDAGMNITWTYQGNRLKKGQRIFTGWGASPMGYALPAGIGAYYATKSNQVIVIAGDGGFQMNIQELQAVAFHKIPLKIFIINNESLGNTRFPASRMFGRSTGNNIDGGYGWPDFTEVAKAYKIKGKVFNSNTNIELELEKILNSKESCLVDVKIDPNQFMLDTPI